MYKKYLYPLTYKYITDCCDEGLTYKDLDASRTFKLMSIFMTEIFKKPKEEKLLDVLDNSAIHYLFLDFFNENPSINTNDLKRNLFILVSQEEQMLFEELFDEAQEDVFEMETKSKLEYAMMLSQEIHSDSIN